MQRAGNAREGAGLRWLRLVRDQRRIRREVPGGRVAPELDEADLEVCSILQIQMKNFDLRETLTVRILMMNLELGPPNTANFVDLEKCQGVSPFHRSWCRYSRERAQRSV